MPKKTLSDRVTILETIIPTICDDLNDIKNNHIKHIQEDVQEMSKCMSSVKRDIVELKIDMSWLKRFFWIIATASVAGLVGQLINFIK